MTAVWLLLVRFWLDACRLLDHACCESCCVMKVSHFNIEFAFVNAEMSEFGLFWFFVANRRRTCVARRLCGCVRRCFLWFRVSFPFFWCVGSSGRCFCSVDCTLTTKLRGEGQPMGSRKSRGCKKMCFVLPMSRSIAH